MHNRWLLDGCEGLFLITSIRVDGVKYNGIGHRIVIKKATLCRGISLLLDVQISHRLLSLSNPRKNRAADKRRRDQR